MKRPSFFAVRMTLMAIVGLFLVVDITRRAQHTHDMDEEIRELQKLRGSVYVPRSPSEMVATVWNRYLTDLALLWDAYGAYVPAWSEVSNIVREDDLLVEQRLKRVTGGVDLLIVITGIRTKGTPTQGELHDICATGLVALSIEDANSYALDRIVTSTATHARSTLVTDGVCVTLKRVSDRWEVQPV